MNVDKDIPGISMEDIHKFENSDELLGFRFADTGVPMWMFIRSLLIRNTLRVLLGDTYTLRAHKKDKVIKEKSWIDKNIKRNPFLTCRKDVVFAFFLDERLTLHNDGFYDELIMPYMRILKNRSTTLMSGGTIEGKTFECNHINWKSDRCFYKVLNLKKECRICQEDKNNINALLKYIYEFYPINIDGKTKIKLKQRLNYVAMFHKRMIEICNIYLGLVKPKLVFISHGSYQLPFNSAMILACKERNITTAEFQHALVGKFHENFNYGEMIIKNKMCRAVMPDYLLTMGGFWHSQVNVPQKLFLLGYAMKITKGTIPKNDNILFAVNDKYEQYEEILNDLLPRFNKGTNIYFRLHPADVSQSLVKRFQKYTEYCNFYLANDYSLDYYMKKCRYVIVDGSTVGYEALYLGRIVFFLNNSICKLVDCDKLDDAKLFGTVDEFMELWKKREEYKPTRHKEFYGENWKKNYLEFLHMQGIRVDLRRLKK